MAEVNFGNILGGVNYSVPPNELPQYYVADCQNVLPTLNGYATPRGGSSKLNSVAYGSNITSFHEIVLGTTSYKYATTGELLGHLDDSGIFSNLKDSLSNDAYGQWLDYGGYAIFVNDVNKPQKINGTAISNLTTDESGLEGASCIAEWGERIWVAVGATLYGSALRAPTDFSTSTTDTGYYSGVVGDSSKNIIGLFPFFDMLLIGKKNQLYMLTGAPETKSSTFRLQPLQTKSNDSIGFTSKNAIAQVGNDGIFLDGFDIKRFSGITQYGDIESASILANIKDFFRDSSGAGLDKGYLQNAHFFHYKYKQQVYCSIPTGSDTRYWFVIDYSNFEIREQLKLPFYSIYPMGGLTPLCFGGVEDGSKLNIYAGCNDGFVRKLDTGYNDDDPVDSHVTWGFGLPSRRIQPVNIGLNVKYSTACTLEPSYAMGLQSYSEIIDSSNYTNLDSQDLTHSSWRGSGNVVSKKLSSFMNNTDISFLFKLRHNKNSETYELRKCYFTYRGKQRY